MPDEPAGGGEPQLADAEASSELLAAAERAGPAAADVALLAMRPARVVAFAPGPPGSRTVMPPAIPAAMPAEDRTAPMPVLEGVTHRFVDVGGLRVHVAEAGQGEPLVLLHGWPQHWWCWRLVVPLLQDRYRPCRTCAATAGLAHHRTATTRSSCHRPAGAAGRDRAAAGRARRPRLGRLDRVPRRAARPGALPGVPRARHRAPLPAADARPALQSWRLAYQVGRSAPLLPEALLRSSPALVEQIVTAGSTRREAFADGQARTYGEVLREPDRARASVRLHRSMVLREGLPVALGATAAGRCGCRPGSSSGTATRSRARRCSRAHPPASRSRCLGVGHFVPEEAPAAVAERVRALFG